jgi:hypothetical protein
MFQVLLGAMIGVASGMRHAFEPDHLAAVSTLVAGDANGRARSSVRFAAAWGFGHALMLLFVSGALVLTRRQMPPVVAQAFEIVVAAMLVALGVRALVRAHRHAAAHADGVPHVHEAAHDLRRPLFVGVVHGLAGSGALTALTLAAIGSPLAGLVYIALYGFGAMVGMALLAGLAGAPLARLSRSPLAMRALTSVTGTASLVVGLVWGIQAAFAFGP